MSTDGASDTWQRLSIRVVWIDVVVTLLSLAPGAVAIWGFQVEVSLGTLWPLGIVAVFGVIGGVSDILRWAFTRYRVTATDIERRTGLFVRQHRTIRRDRIRSVDTSAKLRHRLTGLRIVTIGAGQQTGAGESALVLDALSRVDAADLKERLILDRRAAAARADAVLSDEVAKNTDRGGSDDVEAPERVEVLATFRPGWIVYNVFSIWAFLMATGLLWGGYWLASTFGIDLLQVAAGLADWDGLGPIGTTVLAVASAGILGALGLAVSFVLGYGRFELSRVRTPDRSYLRTQRGVLSTREVNRDESRMRGLSIGEPVLWRWMGMADTNVITTGLNVWDTSEPTAILPRGPLSVARRVTVQVFSSGNPFDAPLRSHPFAAFWRRAWWATLLAAGVSAALVMPALAGAIPGWIPWLGAVLWGVGLLAALIAYRALGHAIKGEYGVFRAGLFSRTTSALRRDAVSTIAVRQSLLQRRWGLATVSAMTAAGWSAYDAPDLAVEKAFRFADEVAPGLLDGVLLEAGRPVPR